MTFMTTISLAYASIGTLSNHRQHHQRGAKAVAEMLHITARAKRKLPSGGRVLRGRRSLWWWLRGNLYPFSLRFPSGEHAESGGRVQRRRSPRWWWVSGNLNPLLAPVPVRGTRRVRRESPERAQLPLVVAQGEPQTPSRSGFRQGNTQSPAGESREGGALVGGGSAGTSTPFSLRFPSGKHTESGGRAQRGRSPLWRRLRGNLYPFSLRFLSGKHTESGGRVQRGRRSLWWWLRGNLKPLFTPVPVRETRRVRRESPERAEPSLVGALGVPPNPYPLRFPPGKRTTSGEGTGQLMHHGERCQTITSLETKKTAPTMYGRRGPIALAADITSSRAPSCPAARRTWRRKRFVSADSRGRTPHTSTVACSSSSFIDVSVTYKPAPVVYSAPKRCVNECAGGSAVGSTASRKRFGP